MLEKTIFFEQTAGSSDWKLATKFKYAAWTTPHHNNIVELGFASCAWSSQAMFNDANMDTDCRTQLANESFSLANINCNLAVIEYQDKQMTSFEAAGQRLPSLIANIRAFGEAGVIKINKNGKLGDRGKTCIFVNYPDNNSIDCFQIFNHSTGKVIKSRNIPWLN